MMEHWIKVGNRAIDMGKVEEVAIWQTSRRGKVLPCVQIFFIGNHLQPNGDLGGGVTELVDPEASEFLSTFADITGIYLALEIPL